MIGCKKVLPLVGQRVDSDHRWCRRIRLLLGGDQRPGEGGCGIGAAAITLAVARARLPRGADTRRPTSSTARESPSARPPALDTRFCHSRGRGPRARQCPAEYPELRDVPAGKSGGSTGSILARHLIVHAAGRRQLAGTGHERYADPGTGDRSDERWFRSREHRGQLLVKRCPSTTPKRHAG